MRPLFVCPDDKLFLQNQCGLIYIQTGYVHLQVSMAKALPEVCDVLLYLAQMQCKLPHTTTAGQLS